MYSRRDFTVALGALPLAKAWAARIDSTVKGVHLGAMTYSFRDLPRTPGVDNVDALIQALKECAIGEIELYSPNVEPGRNPGVAPAQTREELRQWRLSTPASFFTSVRRKFDDAGITIHDYYLEYRPDFTDAEIDKTFEQGKALGVGLIGTSTKVSMAAHLLSFAERHGMNVAFHGHSEIDKPDEFSTPESFQKALDISRHAKVNLDIGHFTAANGDAVAYIQEHHDRITHLHVKDRKRNNGANFEWGQGDTPIREVLRLLRDKRYPIPALIEYEYKGTGTSVEEVKKCLAYMKQALA